MSEKPTLLDYLIVVFKWKRLVAGVALSITAAAALVVFLLPPVYVAKTRILPPDTDNSAASAQLLSQLGGGALSGALLGKKSMNDLYVGLLQSRTVLDRIVDRFQLVEVYEVAYREDARKRLQASLQVAGERKSGVITIGVEDRDPKRAARMANAFVEELKHLNQELALTEASQRRLFFEEKLKDAKEAMVRSEEAMKGFQEQTGAIEMKEQAKAIIEAVAKLRAEIASKQVQLKVLKTYSMPQNPDLQKTEEELRGMKEQLGRLEGKAGGNHAVLLSSGNVPAAGTGYIRKMRDLKYSETLFELLAKQYEVAKMDESRSGAPIQVIDKALEPEKRARPKRAKTVAAAALAGAFAGILASFLMESRERMVKDPAARARLETLKRYATFRRRETITN
ncbi:GumC family protein [Geobacter sp. DSM 9736]|uniref:GumC family protein n=1 Tax=Geobacter sp. DSM 9736 TaxID=1277350 RepID=UPI000B61006F|nr:Wzz/FepE/Etk N-terminal domain-containing protein [Geobacter sp. DSM 9736]SNB47972.1 Capsule polysaccharide export protein KpsE/RkpR [Geobacter sp. DSM 9736]